MKTTEAVYAADPNAPLMELRTDLAQISTDAIDDAVFAVPEDYRQASSEELNKVLTPVLPALRPRLQRYGLDQKAIEAVSQWKFRPAQKDGQPLNVRATIEVSFRLVDRPGQQ